MPRHLKLIALATFICIISYLSYLAGAYRNYKSIETLFITNLLEFELAETRHDEGIVQALADGNKEAVFMLAQHRYFIRTLYLFENLEKTQYQTHKDIVRAHITEAQTLHRKLSYKFPTEEENKKWETLSASGQTPN